MTRINNLNGQRALSGLKDQARQAGLSSPMNNSGIGEGGIEVYDQGTINVSDGNLIVNGTATISGVLNADGTVTLSGTIKISGPLTVSGVTNITGNTTVTGNFDVNGPMKTTGTLSVEGVSTLKNDLNVTGGGKIVAGETIIRPSGAINFGSALTIGPDPSGGSSISSGFAKYYLTPGGGSYFHQFTGGVYVDGRVNAMDMILSNLQTTSQPANLYIGSDGVIKKSTA